MWIKTRRVWFSELAWALFSNLFYSICDAWCSLGAKLYPPLLLYLPPTPQPPPTHAPNTYVKDVLDEAEHYLNTSQDLPLTPFLSSDSLASYNPKTFLCLSSACVWMRVSLFMYLLCCSIFLSSCCAGCKRQWNSFCLFPYTLVVFIFFIFPTWSFIVCSWSHVTSAYPSCCFSSLSAHSLLSLFSFYWAQLPFLHLDSLCFPSVWCLCLI